MPQFGRCAAVFRLILVKPSHYLHVIVCCSVIYCLSGTTHIMTMQILHHFKITILGRNLHCQLCSHNRFESIQEIQQLDLVVPCRYLHRALDPSLLSDVVIPFVLDREPLIHVQNPSSFLGIIIEKKRLSRLAYNPFATCKCPLWMASRTSAQVL